MGSYRSTDNPDRAKAAAGVVAVHVALAALVLSGLTVRTALHDVAARKVFDISDDVPPPPIQQPRPKPDRKDAPKDEAAPENVKSKAAEIVASRQVSLPIPLPISAANVAGPGNDRTSGAGSQAGPGSGAGGQGNGLGGGGNGGSGSGFTPARLLNKIPDSDYRRISASRMPRGSATIALRVEADGSAANCRVVRSSGDAAVDDILCGVATSRLRFSPARDASGRAIAQDIRYTPTWRPN